MYWEVIAIFLVRRYFGLPDDICNSLQFFIHSRFIYFSQSVDFAYRIYIFQKTIAGEMNTIWDSGENGASKNRKCSTWGMHTL